MNEWLLAIIIGAAFGLIIGIKIVRDSSAKLPVQGGPAAQLFHYLASVGLSGMLPFIVAGIIVGLPAVKLFGTAVGFLVAAAVFLLIHALFERSATPSVA
jgi:hypothetical protein